MSPPLRYQGTSIAIAVAGTTIAHGLQNPVGTAAAPTEWGFNHASAASTVDNAVYRSAAPTTTLFSLAASTRAATVDVFCAIPMSIMQ